jgi:hypothetical protein
MSSSFSVALEPFSTKSPPVAKKMRAPVDSASFGPEEKLKRFSSVCQRIGLTIDGSKREDLAKYYTVNIILTLFFSRTPGLCTSAIIDILAWI